MPTITEKNYVHDVLMYYTNREYSIVAAPLKNSTGSAVDVDNIIGHPVYETGGDFTIPLTASSSSVNGVVIGLNLNPKRVQLANGASTSGKYLILKRGPAILNKDKMVAKDPAGSDYNYTSIETALKALNPPILLTTEPGSGVTSVQTT